MEPIKHEFLPFSWRVTVLHMTAYLIAGVIALVFMDYKELFASGSLSSLMRPTDSPIVAVGPFLQIIQGFVMSLFLFPFRSIFISSKNGWLYLLLLLAGFSIFAPEIPGPGTFEGILYTKISIQEHLLSLPETLIYSIVFSALFALWYRYPKKIWNMLSIISVCLIFLMSILGYLAAIGLLKN